MTSWSIKSKKLKYHFKLLKPSIIVVNKYNIYIYRQREMVIKRILREFNRLLSLPFADKKKFINLI